MRRLALLMAATSLLMLISIHVAVATSSSLVWWGDAEWHYRVPVEINVTDVNITDCPVEHWVNFTQLLTDLNISGTFDENSTRVIEHNATTDTVIKEVSSRFDKSAGYNATTNATGEVVWTIDGTTLINSTRLYYIYFDIVENGVKSLPDYPAIDYPISLSDTFTDTTKVNMAASTNVTVNMTRGDVRLAFPKEKGTVNLCLNKNASIDGGNAANAVDGDDATYASFPNLPTTYAIVDLNGTFEIWSIRYRHWNWESPGWVKIYLDQSGTWALVYENTAVPGSAYTDEEFAVNQSGSRIKFECDGPTSANDDLCEIEAWEVIYNSTVGYQSPGTLTSITTTTQAPIISVTPTWNVTTTANTTLSINVSVDNGTTWYAASNGTAINISYDPANIKALYRANFTTSDVNATPELYDINLVHRTELRTITQKAPEAGEILEVFTRDVDGNGVWDVNVTIHKNGTSTLVAQGTTNATGHLRTIVSCRPTTENETFDINVSKRWYVDNSTSAINPPTNVTLMLDHHVGLKAFGYLDKYVYWFGRGSSSSFTPTWTDDNVNPDYVIWPMAAVNTTDPIALKVREFNTIRAFVTVLDEKGVPVPNLTVKMWVVNDTGYYINKTASDDGNRRYHAVWEGWKHPNTTAAGYKAVGADGEAMYGKFTSRKTYYVYVDVNGDDIADLKLPFMAYCVMDTHWALSSSSQTPSHCENGTLCGANQDAHYWSQHSRLYGLYCTDCHGWGDGVIPSMENISYGMVHPRPESAEFVSCNNATCHGNMTDPQTVPGYPAGTYNITAPYYPYPVNCTNCHTYRDSVTPTIAGHNNSIECKYCHAGNFHALLTTEVNTPGYSSTYYSTCYRICHQVQEKHNNTLDCDQCHQNMSTAPFHQSNLTAIRRCDSCHQNVSHVAPHIPSPLNHSTGQKWGNYWDNTSDVSACVYCHGDAAHSTLALGPPLQFKGDNVVNSSISSGNWCAGCHYQGYQSGTKTYDDMVIAYNNSGVNIPPEITGNATYAPITVTGYLTHSPQTTDCFACHGGNLSIDAGVTAFVHNVSLSEIADCISCHGVGEPATLKVDISTTIKSIHKNLNKDVTSTVDSQNKMCWACHGVGAEPSGTRHPSNYKNPRNCEGCHVGYIRFNATKVSEHYSSGDEIKVYKACWVCHKIGYNKYLLEIRFNGISTDKIKERVAHYGEPLS
ncbi:MAG: hypothetical protein QMC78_05355, partial [Methanocellales archaeon]|nr:hypothetical protein [Methanocellales archaeon]